MLAVLREVDEAAGPAVDTLLEDGERVFGRLDTVRKVFERRAVKLVGLDTLEEPVERRVLASVTWLGFPRHGEMMHEPCCRARAVSHFDALGSAEPLELARIAFEVTLVVPELHVGDATA